VLFSSFGTIFERYLRHSSSFWGSGS